MKNKVINYIVDKKNRIVILLLIIFLLFLFIKIIVSFVFNESTTIVNDNDVTKYKGIIYCSWHDWCYIYKNRKIYLYEYDDEMEGKYLGLFFGKYKFKNEQLYNKSYYCKHEYSTILKWNEDKFVVKCGDTVEHYFNVENQNPNSYEDYYYDLTGEAFKNDKYEMYFISEDLFIFADSKELGWRDYRFIGFGDEYLEFLSNMFNSDGALTFAELPSTFNKKTKSFLGYEAVSLDELQYINKNFVDMDNAIEQSKYYMDYYFKKDSYYDSYEYYLKDNLLTVANEENQWTYSISAIYAVNDKIYYKLQEGNDSCSFLTFYKDTNELCRCDRCLQKVNKDEIEYLK